MKKKVLFIVNDPAFFISHRLPIALAGMQAGFEVHVATGQGPAVADVVSAVTYHHVLPIKRSGRNPMAEVGALIAIYRLLRRLKPDLVHLVTIKPVLYGGLAARLARVPALVSAISGLGFVFSGNDIRKRGLQWLVIHAYKLALLHSNAKIIFQNPDDRDFIVRTVGLPFEKAEMIPGSGVDLACYPFIPESVGMPIVAMASRLLRDKGVFEFIAAARLLHSRGVRARYWLIGDLDRGNPASITEEDLAGWRNEGIVECLGYRSDISKLFAQAHIIALPSYYREGLPKVLVEAAACGRAVVTTDMPGCRDAVEPGVTGLLVPPRNAKALADALHYLIVDESVRKKMGAMGRALAERDYAIEKIVAAHMVVYRALLDS